MKSLHVIMILCIVLLAGSLFAQDAAPSAACCQGLTGNADGDAGDIVDVGDLTHLIGFLFLGGPEPVCPEEGNIDGAGGTDVGDLTHLIGFLFLGGADPVACPAPSNVVFDDEYGDGVTYQAFAGSLLDAVQTSTDSTYAGSQGLEVRIPGTDPWWSGGAFVDTASGGRDLSSFNALTFWAKASTAATLDVAGLANDNTGTSQYIAEVAGLALTTSWQKYVIPIPLAEKLTDEAGLFYFAEGEGLEYNIWVDEILFEDLATITNPRPAITPATVEVDSGETVALSNGVVTFDVDGTDMDVSAMPAYFTYSSSNPSVVSVGVDGVVTAVGIGTAELTATLGGVPATGAVTVNVASAEAIPTTPAPTPTPDPADVISLFSDAYTNEPVDTWSASWDQADVADFLIGSDNTKKYTNLSFAGIEFISNTIDASTMTHFHMDVWTPDETAAPAVFKVKLVDLGADGAFGGGDDVEHELTFDENSMNTGSWVSIDVPLASFTNLVTTGHLAQLIISGDPNTVYVDNIYFYDAGIPTEPVDPAPTPMYDAASVLSLYSDIYTSATTVTAWSAVWDQADVADVVIGSDNAKKYTSLNFAGIEFISSPLDASSMTRFHMDVWTPDPTASPSEFKVKLVDFGADGSSGGGDDVEHELIFDETVMNTGSWVSIDVPLSDFVNLTTTEHLAQLIISGTPNTVYIDNIYFYSGQPLSAAPAPSEASADVISIFSDVYTNVSVDTWSSIWDDADYSDEVIGSDNVKKYFNLNYAIIEFTTTTIDATSMTHIHLDVWTPDPTSAPAVFRVKLVDFGANGIWDENGDDVEHEITLDENTMSTGGWVSIELALADFTNLVTRGHVAQLIISGDPNTVFVDNVYFHK